MVERDRKYKSRQRLKVYRHRVWGVARILVWGHRSRLERENRGAEGAEGVGWGPAARPIEGAAINTALTIREYCVTNL